MKRPLAAAVALVALLAALLIVLAGRTSVERRARGALAVGAASGPAIAIRVEPVGLSIEYPLLARELGARRCPPAALVRAIRGLRSPTIRVGGDSQDQTAPVGAPPHAGVSDLPRGFWSRLGCLARETNSAVVVGLNLASGEPAWGARMAADARAVIAPSRLSFELGNEPDIYGSHVPWWNGTALVRTPMPFATYLARARALAAELGPDSSIEGPDFASGRWVKALPALARKLHLRALDAHFYPLDACRSDAGAGVAALLSRAVQLKLDERVRVARDARAAGLPALISEANSISCGGVAGVSDSPAAAVWAARLVVTALRSGFEAVRFHSSGGAYDPFTLRGGRLTLRPLYLGLQAVAALIQPGAKLRAIPSAKALDGVAITTAASSTDILSNYTASPAAVTVAARRRARVEAIIAQPPTRREWTVTGARGRALVTLPPNSIVAITTASG